MTRFDGNTGTSQVCWKQLPSRHALSYPLIFKKAGFGRFFDLRPEKKCINWRLVAAPASRHQPGKAAAVSGLLPVRPHCQKTRCRRHARPSRTGQWRLMAGDALCGTRPMIGGTDAKVKAVLASNSTVSRSALHGRYVRYFLAARAAREAMGQGDGEEFSDCRN